MSESVESAPVDATVDPAAPTPPPLVAEPLGGWLYLPMMGLVVSPFIMLAGMAGNASAIVNAQAKLIEAANSGYKALLVDEIIMNFCLLAYLLYTTVKFFGRQHSAPRLIIIFFALGLVLGLRDLVLTCLVFRIHINLALAATLPPLLAKLGSAAIWIPYFLFSKRVKRTFLNS